MISNNTNSQNWVRMIIDPEMFIKFSVFLQVFSHVSSRLASLRENSLQKHEKTALVKSDYDKSDVTQIVEHLLDNSVVTASGLRVG